MLTIGLTGKTGAGKTTVAAYLKEKGCYIIDGDVIARQITEKGSDVLPLLQKAFGEDILDEFVFLESYSSSDEVLEVAEALEEKDHRIAFLMSAHRWGTVFETEDYVELFYYLDDEKLRDYILINSDMEYTKDELELIEG